VAHEAFVVIAGIEIVARQGPVEGVALAEDVTPIVPIARQQICLAYGTLNPALYSTQSLCDQPCARTPDLTIAPYSLLLSSLLYFPGFRLRSTQATRAAPNEGL